MWKHNNPKLNIRQAAEKFVEECFLGRAVDWDTFAGHPIFVEATFKLVDGERVYSIASVDLIWHCASQS